MSEKSLDEMTTVEMVDFVTKHTYEYRKIYEASFKSKEDQKIHELELQISFFTNVIDYPELTKTERKKIIKNIKQEIQIIKQGLALKEALKN